MCRKTIYVPSAKVVWHLLTVFSILIPLFTTLILKGYFILAKYFEVEDVVDIRAVELGVKVVGIRNFDLYLMMYWEFMLHLVSTGLKHS